VDYRANVAQTRGMLIFGDLVLNIQLLANWMCYEFWLFWWWGVWFTSCLVIGLLLDVYILILYTGSYKVLLILWGLLGLDFLQSIFTANSLQAEIWQIISRILVVTGSAILESYSLRICAIMCDFIDIIYNFIL